MLGLEAWIKEASRGAVWNWLMIKNIAVARSWRWDSVTRARRLSLARRRVAQQSWQSARSPCHGGRIGPGQRIVRGVINYGADETWWRWDVSEMTALVSSVRSHADIWKDPGDALAASTPALLSLWSPSCHGQQLFMSLMQERLVTVKVTRVMRLHLQYNHENTCPFLIMWPRDHHLLT